MFFRIGPGSSGYNAQPEFLDWDAHINIPASGSLVTGQCVARDVTQFPGSAGADTMVMPANANAGPIGGVYQGPPINNPSSVNPLPVDVVLRLHGYGVVLAAAVTAGTAVTVGGVLNMGANNSVLQSATALGALTTFAGSALATGSVTAKGATLITVPGSGQTNLPINALINCN